MDVPAVQNGFKYRLNDHGKFSNGCCKRLNGIGKISGDASRSNRTGKISSGSRRAFEWETKNFERMMPAVRTANE